MNTGGPGRSRRGRWPMVVGVVAACMVVACSAAGVVAWRLVSDDGSGRASSVPFPTAALQAAAAPFRPALGGCEIEQVGYARSGSTVTTCEPGPGAPGPVVFTEYTTPTDLVPASAAETYPVWGPRNGGLLRAGANGINWRDHLKRVSITVEEQPDWDVDRMMQWWDETTAGAILAGPGANLAGSPAGSQPGSSAGSSAGARPASPAATAQAAAPAAPQAVAGMPYLMRSFARPWWGDLKGCTADVRPVFRDVSFYPEPPIGLMIRSMHLCVLRDGWQNAGGFDKIMFVAWDNRMYQRMDHDEMKKLYGPDQLRDQPGLAGPKSGMFMVKDVKIHCLVYWDDEAVAVAAWVLAPCRKNPKTTPASITAFWQARG